MHYPVQWLDHTFDSKSKTEQLLAPELETGTLTLHDYHLSLSFLPGYHRYWPSVYGCTAASAAIAYARLRRPPWSNARVLVVTGLLGLTGAVYGGFRRARAHWTFTQSLENAQGFIQAMENVNVRTGGAKPLGFTVPSAQRITDDTEPSSGVDIVRDGDWDPKRDTDQTAARISSDASSLRWEQIRAANARTAGQNSSWDVLRQKHERTIIRTQPSGSNDRKDTADDRASEQARFDAMVEAERRNNQSS